MYSFAAAGWGGGVEDGASFEPGLEEVLAGQDEAEGVVFGWVEVVEGCERGGCFARRDRREWRGGAANPGGVLIEKLL